MSTELSSFMPPAGPLRRIGAQLGVDHRKVAVRLHPAGVTMRRGGPARYEVDTQRILDLRDQGLTMTAVAAQVGMSVPGAWARYYRARPTARAGASVSTAPVRMIPWQKVLAAALNEHEVIGVRAAATAYLGHEPTRAQITAARRAAVWWRKTWPAPCMFRFGLVARRGRSIISCWSGLTPRRGMIKYWRQRPVSHQQQTSQPGRCNSASQL